MNRRKNRIKGGFFQLYRTSTLYRSNAETRPKQKTVLRVRKTISTEFRGKLWTLIMKDSFSLLVVPSHSGKQDSFLLRSWKCIYVIDAGLHRKREWMKLVEQKAQLVHIYRRRSFVPLSQKKKIY